MKLQSEEFQIDCHSIFNFSETAELDQAVSVTTDRIYERVKHLAPDRKHPTKKSIYDKEYRPKKEGVIKVFRLLKATDPLDQEINLHRLAEYRKLRSAYNRAKRVKKKERQMETNEEINEEMLPFGDVE